PVHDGRGLCGARGVRHLGDPIRDARGAHRRTADRQRRAGPDRERAAAGLSRPRRNGLNGPAFACYRTKLALARFPGVPSNTTVTSACGLTPARGEINVTKKESRDRGPRIITEQRQWQPNARKICKTPSSITYAKVRRR